jgi:type II restriction/modification system DNA methylase subunit YeeA
MSSDINPLDKLNIDDIVECFKNAVNQALTKGKEENLRVLVLDCIKNKIIEPLKKEGINIPFELEYTLPSGKRIDLLCGNVIIEFKDPYKFSSEFDIEKAKSQVMDYIKEKAEHDKKDLDNFLGVIISDKITFVRYDKIFSDWMSEGPYEINEVIIRNLINALIGLRRKSLSAKELVKDFGINSQISKKIVRLLYTKLLNTTEKEKTWALFNDWKRLFGQIIGYSDEKDLEKFKELKELKEYYEIEGNNIIYSYLIFAIHTYYALIMKLLAAETAYLYISERLRKSYIIELDNAYKSKGIDGLKSILQELESGGIFKDFLGIENFLEGDYFSWYIEKIDDKLAKAIIELVEELSNYDMTIIRSHPESTRDLLKDLYQNLIPRDIRHRFGEYYTPDWLAELLLDEIGLSYKDLENMGKEDPLKPLKIRVLDPACGSGTFLILYISRLREYAKKKDDKKKDIRDDLVKHVLENVVGYDLNPLAVLAARTNYLLAVGDLIFANRNKLGSIEIPIYLADSIMIETKAEITEKYYILRTTVGEFKIPVNIAQNTNLLRKILDEMKMFLENGSKPEEFESRISPYNLNSSEKKSLIDLYKKLLDLEKHGKDGVWISIIKNAFAPLLKGKFDYIVGNPPWINWENLPEQYRESSKELWEKYGLLVTKGKTGMGKVKKDLSMLFLARCFDLYLKVGGKLGFVITFTVFKNQAGAGFREFLAKNTKIYIIHDLVTLAPFEGATNRTGIIIVEKVCELNNMNECTIIKEVQKENINSIKHIVWNGKKIDPDTSLEDVLKITKHYEIAMMPLIPNDPSSPWMQVKPNIVNAIRKVISGNQYYEAHAGVYVGLNQVYFIKVREKTPDGMLVIENQHESGQKREVKQVDARVEPDLVYPLIRGRDVKKWYVEFKDRYIILPSDLKGNNLDPTTMRSKYPNAYKYFYQFFNDLINRRAEPYKSKLKPYRNKNIPLERAEKLAPPFYWVFNISPSLAPYKVVWGAISGAITGKALSFACAVAEPVNEKPVVPDHSVILIPIKTASEAYYIVGILNSIIIRSIIASYTYELGQYTHIIDIFNIPQFDPNNNLHKKIADLSKKAHELAKCIYSNNKPDYCKTINANEELKKVEDEIDLAVAELYGITKEELEGFKELMNILSGK